MKKLYTDESFSVDAELTPEGVNSFKQIMKEISMIPPDYIVLKNKETGEEVKFVSEGKLREVLEKTREYRDMEIKGVNFYERPGVAERCFDLLQEVVS